jgi:hypothetical protein
MNQTLGQQWVRIYPIDCGFSLMREILSTLDEFIMTKKPYLLALVASVFGSARE